MPPAPARFPAIYAYVRTAHILLAAGLVALWLALLLPWGTDSHGMGLYLRDFTSPRLASSGVPVAGWAINTATHLVLWALGLSAVLILANIAATALDLAAYRGNLPGCLASVLLPVVWLAGMLLLLDLIFVVGFGLLGLISQIPGLYAAGFSNQVAAAPATGVYLWWLGALLAFLGAIGQMGMRHRAW
jgi:hypothetical protein